MRRAGLARWLLAAGLALTGPGAWSAPPPLPAAVVAESPALRPLGEARLRVLLWHVYDAALWVAGEGYRPDAPFALDIRYAMDIRGADLADKSIELMRRLGYDDAPQLERWRAAMRRAFPDIRAGDRLVGVHVPGRETRFYDARGLVGTVADAQFARAFFAIWLDERTTEPRLRRELLGLGP